jgi:hypothetical protein
VKWLVALACMAGTARADLAVRTGSVAVADDAEARAIVARLPGQLTRVAPGRVWISDVAGEGSPWVGVVERRGRALWLVGELGDAFELRGPLARPRLAGPGYTVWVLGDLDEVAHTMRVKRLGILRRPR